MNLDGIDCESGCEIAANAIPFTSTTRRRFLNSGSVNGQSFVDTVTCMNGDNRDTCGGQITDNVKQQYRQEDGGNDNNDNQDQNLDEDEETQDKLETKNSATSLIVVFTTLLFMALF